MRKIFTIKRCCTDVKHLAQCLQHKRRSMNGSYHHHSFFFYHHHSYHWSYLSCLNYIFISSAIWRVSSSELCPFQQKLLETRPSWIWLPSNTHACTHTHTHKQTHTYTHILLSNLCIYYTRWAPISPGHYILDVGSGNLANMDTFVLTYTVVMRVLRASWEAWDNPERPNRSRATESPWRELEAYEIWKPACLPVRFLVIP